MRKWAPGIQTGVRSRFVEIESTGGVTRGKFRFEVVHGEGVCVEDEREAGLDTGRALPGEPAVAPWYGEGIYREEES